MNKGLLIIFLFCLMGSCSYDKYRYNFFEGNWVLINYLDTVEKYRSLSTPNNTGMVEVILKRHHDSVTFIYDNVEHKTFAFSHKTSNQIIIDNYINNKPLSIYINEQAYYLSYKIDSEQFVFIKPDDRLVDSAMQNFPPISTQRVINSLTLGGIYKQEGNNIPVQFYTNGNISGLNQFNYYETCVGGDCRSFYDGDVVIISSKNGLQYCTWKWQGKVLTIYALKLVSLPNEKPDYIKAEKLFTLTKIK